MTADDDRTPIDQVVEQAADLFVYAPIGLFFEAPSLLPKLAEQGRVHTRNARLFGQFALRQGEAEVRRQVERLEEQAGGLLRMFGLVREPESAAPPPPPAPEAAGTGLSTNGQAAAPGAAREPSPAPTETAPPPAPAVDELAITDYDSLSASQVVTRLEGLTPAELEAVRAYEAAHRGRKTILNKVAQLQG